MLKLPIPLLRYPQIMDTKLGQRIFGDYKVRTKDPEALPRKIYTFWDSGVSQAPEVVQFCVQSWQDKNPNWDFQILDAAMAEDILPRSQFPSSMIVQHYSDVLRTKLVSEHGGVWVDATCLCMRPLDDWIRLIFNQCEFFAFSRPYVKAAISNWFFAATPGSKIAHAWLTAQHQYWSAQPTKTVPYHVHHYLFDHLTRNNKDVREAWRHVPRLSAETVHVLQYGLTSEDLAKDDQFYNLLRSAPVQKLTYRKNITVSQIEEQLSAL